MSDIKPGSYSISELFEYFYRLQSAIDMKEIELSDLKEEKELVKTEISKKMMIASLSTEREEPAA